MPPMVHPTTVLVFHVLKECDDSVRQQDIQLKQGHKSAQQVPRSFLGTTFNVHQSRLYTTIVLQKLKQLEHTPQRDVIP